MKHENERSSVHLKEVNEYLNMFNVNNPHGKKI